MNKASLSEQTARQEVCPSLNERQIRAFLRNYTSDEFDHEPVHPLVLSELASKEKSTDPLLFDVDHFFSIETTSFGTQTSLVQLMPIQVPSYLIEKPGFVFLQCEVVE